jgi:hypothetical protein
MDPVKRLSAASNTFLKEIYDQLDPTAQLLFSKLLSSLDKPSPSEYLFQAAVNELPEDEFEELLENAILNGDIEKEHLDACFAEYPSILTPAIRAHLLHHFEE